MKRHTTISFILLLLFFVAGGCKKRPGEGGTSSVNGRIWVEDWNTAFTIKNGEYAGADEDVFIIYGDELSYGDKTRANYKGEFQFNYLRKGKYKIYVYSKDKTLTSQSGDTSVVSDFEISKNKQSISLGELRIYK